MQLETTQVGEAEVSQKVGHASRKTEQPKALLDKRKGKIYEKEEGEEESDDERQLVSSAQLPPVPPVVTDVERKTVKTITNKKIQGQSDQGSSSDSSNRNIAINNAASKPPQKRVKSPTLILTSPLARRATHKSSSVDDPPPPPKRHAPQTPTSLRHSETIYNRGTETDIPEISSPLLSPGAIEQLKEFDEWMLAAEEAERGKGRGGIQVPDPEPGLQNQPPSPNPSNAVADISLLPPPADTHDDDVAIHQMYDQFLDFDGNDRSEPQPPLKSKKGSNHASIPPVLGSTSLPVPVGVPPKSIRIGTSNSYRQGVVPETETESSTNNTQSQSQPQSQELPLPPVPQIAFSVAPTTPEKRSHPATSPGKTPHRLHPSIIAQMKPRTPKSGSGSLLSLHEDAGMDYDYDYNETENVKAIPVPPRDTYAITTTTTSTAATKSSKGLRPIPRLSPSQFTPHLPPVSSIENVDTVEMESAAPMSSIEQFSSPEKKTATGGRTRVRKKKGKGKERDRGKDSGKDMERGRLSENDDDTAKHTNNPSITERDDESLEAVVMERGKQLAESARQAFRKAARGGASGEAEGTVKTSLADLLKASWKRHKEKEWEKSKILVRQQYGPEGSRAKPGRQSAEPEVRRARKMGGTDRGLNRGGTEPIRGKKSGIDKVSVAIPEEEEESTQDLMMDLTSGGELDKADIQMGRDFGTSAVAEQAQSQEHITTAEPEKVIEGVKRHKGKERESDGPKRLDQQQYGPEQVSRTKPGRQSTEPEVGKAGEMRNMGHGLNPEDAEPIGGKEKSDIDKVPVAIPEEEEESTQDLMMDLAHGRTMDEMDVQMGRDTGKPVVEEAQEQRETSTAEPEDAIEKVS